MGCKQSCPKKKKNPILVKINLSVLSSYLHGDYGAWEGGFLENRRPVRETEKALTGIGRARGRDVEELHGRAKTVHVINMLCNKI